MQIHWPIFAFTIMMTPLQKSLVNTAKRSRMPLDIGNIYMRAAA